MKKNTALMELIEWLQNGRRENKSQPATRETVAEDMVLEIIISHATSLLSKEREDIENAYSSGKYHEANGSLSEIEMKPSEYFNDTFSQLP